MKRSDTGNERFLSRWSRLKRASEHETAADPASPPASPEPPATTTGNAPAPTVAPAPSPAMANESNDVVASLPPVDSLTMESDFAPFFQPKVPEALRRAAVKKLFADPHFNIMDGLDTYIGDYSKSDPIPPEMLRQIRHARGLLGFDEEDARKEKEAIGAAALDDAAVKAAANDAPASAQIDTDLKLPQPDPIEQTPDPADPTRPQD